MLPMALCGRTSLESLRQGGESPRRLCPATHLADAAAVVPMLQHKGDLRFRKLRPETAETTGSRSLGTFQHGAGVPASISD